MLIYTRERNDSKVLVVLNLSNQSKKIALPAAAAGSYTNLFTQKMQVFNDKENLFLAPWGYAVYVR